MTSKPTDAQLFAVAGATLFGPRWTQPMAELLGWPLDERHQNRTIQRIKAAAERGQDYRINRETWRVLAKEARARSQTLRSMALALEAISG